MCPVSRISSKWTGNPQLNPTEYITIADILAVNNNQSGNKYNSIVLTLGNAYTGETYTQNAQLFNGAGAYTLPLSLGTISNGSFTPANSASFTGANALNNPPVQCLAWVRNDQWMVFATRDVKTQPSNIAVGEIYLYAPASNAFIHLKNDSTVVINGPTTTATNGGTAQQVAMGPALQSLINAVNTFGTTVGALSPNPPTTLAQALADIGTIITAAGTLQSSVASITGITSSVLKADHS